MLFLTAESLCCEFGEPLATLAVRAGTFLQHLCNFRGGSCMFMHFLGRLYALSLATCLA